MLAMQDYVFTQEDRERAKSFMSLLIKADSYHKMNGRTVDMGLFLKEIHIINGGSEKGTPKKRKRRLIHVR